MNKTLYRGVLTMITIVSVLLATLLLPIPSVRSAGTLFVDASAPGPDHDGNSWATAYLDLQDALATAIAGDQIWIADGRYTPGPAGSPAVTFTIREGVALYGGFAGGETTLDARDPALHATVLSGDLAGDDAVDAAGVTLTAGDIVGTNAYHVVTVNGVTSATVLDGVIITGGDARTGAASTYGGGLHVTSSALVIREVAFVGNAAASGGALYLTGSTASLADSVFEGNLATARGGAAVFQNGAPTIAGALFRGNTAATDDGGAIASFASNPALTNVALVHNSSADRGGAIYIYDGAPVLANVTIAGNTGVEGTALYVGNSATPTVTNAIIWANEPSASVPISVQSGTPAISYSLVQGGHTGEENLDADPLFVDLAAGDLRLQEGSPAIDAGLNSAVPEGVTTDLSGAPRFFDGDGDAVSTVDMGAYEWGAETQNATLTVAATDAIVGSEVRVPVAVALEGATLWGADLSISYDVTRLTALRVEAGALATGWALEYNLATAGQIRVSLAGSTAVQSDGELLALVFHAGATVGPAPIEWLSASLNENDIAVTLVDGGVTLYATTAADFSGSPTSGPAPLAVSFTSLATGGFDSYSWTFGDGATSTLANPAHTYTAPGAYDVSLTVSGPGGTATETKLDYVTVYAPAVAAFSATPVDGLAPLQVAFTDQSTGDVSLYAWSFGDGETSNSRNPTHNYASQGTFTVSLTVSGDGGQSTETKTGFITVRLGTISGAVRYWQGDRPVGGSAVVLSGNASATVNTATDGTYAHTGLSRGTFTVTPGEGAVVGVAISPYDASLVLRHAAGLQTLSGYAHTAADVTLNGSATAYDASYILRAAAGLIVLASPSAGVAWRYEPASRSYPTFTEDSTGQDYVALLLGDVSGNWGADADPAALAEPPIAELELSVGDVDPSGLITVTLLLASTEVPVYSLALDLHVEADAALADVVTGVPTQGWMLARKGTTPNMLRLVMAGSRPVKEPGVLARLTFHMPADQATLDAIPLYAEIDEGATSVRWLGVGPDYVLYLPAVHR
ncbi:MAG: PKD domain-containing protein [Anaerolineae bacterium]